jgi:membrane-bound lytic murein transglycosylase D
VKFVTNSKFIIFISLILSSGCAHISSLGPQKSQTNIAPKPGAVGNLISQYSKENIVSTDDDAEEVAEIGSEIELPDVNESEEREIVALRGDGKTSTDDDMSLNYHPNHFTFWQNYFTSKGRERFERQLARGEKYRELIQNVFEEHGLPKDLFYIGLIESGYALSAKSHASAVGPWQFIKGTATRYGLKVNNAVDERRNIHKATVAAAGYFRDLYNIFGSWELALCAYNAGEYRIINAIRKGGTRDYKELVTKRLIPRETIYYVPKMAAARDLSKKRGQFGLNIPRPSQQEVKFYTNAGQVEMTNRYSLQEIARHTGANLEHLTLLNPDLNHRNIAASSKNKMRVIVPNNNHVNKMSSFRPSSRVVPEEVVAESSTQTHTVKRGENLSLIARRYNTSINNLRQLNNLRNNNIRIGQRLNVSSVVASTPARTARKPASTSRVVVKSAKPIEYVVKNGDNLTTIARRFKVSIAEIRKANNMKSDRLFVGRSIKIPSDKNLRVYVVRRGDSLHQIARRFNTTIGAIAAVNSLANNRIYPDQKLHIPSES